MHFRNYLFGLFYTDIHSHSYTYLLSADSSKLNMEVVCVKMKCFKPKELILLIFYNILKAIKFELQFFINF